MVEERLKELGLTLPPAPSPGGKYLPYRISGNILFLAGVICVADGTVAYEGQVGGEQTIETGYEAARICALNALATIKEAIGDLDKIEKFLYLGGYVNAVSGFGQSPQVINGASELFVDVMGERGMHARAAVAVAGLPANATVEIQVNVEVRN